MNKLNQFGLPKFTEEILKNFFSKFSEILEVKIYGSRALGNYSPGSDIDLAVYGDCEDIEGKLKYEIDELSTPYKFDVTIYSLITNINLKKHIDEFGVVFYTRKL